VLLVLFLRSCVRKVVVVVERLDVANVVEDWTFSEQRPSRLDGRIASADPPILPALVTLALHSVSSFHVRVREYC